MIPYEEYLKIVEILEDLDDLAAYHDAKIADGEAVDISWEEVKKRLDQENA